MGAMKADSTDQRTGVIRGLMSRPTKVFLGVSRDASEWRRLQPSREGCGRQSNPMIAVFTAQTITAKRGN